MIKRIFYHFFAVLILFLTLVTLFENKNTMILTMSSNDSHPLNAEIYYAKAGTSFSAERVISVDKVTGDQYYFILPDLKEIQYARLDPSRQKGEISIQKNIQILVSRWFTTSIYTADITKSTVANQIKNYKIENKGIYFKTTGNDSQLNLNLTRTFQNSFYSLHLQLLFIISIIYLSLLFL